VFDPMEAFMDGKLKPKEKISDLEGLKFLWMS